MILDLVPLSISARSWLKASENSGSQDFLAGFNNDYEDLRTFTSADAHGCTSSRLAGIY